jgi:hypothetical protein
VRAGHLLRWLAPLCVFRRENSGFGGWGTSQDRLYQFNCGFASNRSSNSPSALLCALRSALCARWMVLLFGSTSDVSPLSTRLLLVPVVLCTHPGGCCSCRCLWLSAASASPGCVRLASLALVAIYALCGLYT